MPPSPPPDAKAPKCVRCASAESAQWRPADGDGQICFDCFEAAANHAAGSAESTALAAAVAEKPEKSAGEQQSATESVVAAADGVEKTTETVVDEQNVQPQPEPPETITPPQQKPQPSDDRQQRLRKSTRSTRYKARTAVAAAHSSNSSSSTSASNAAPAAVGDRSATPVTAAGSSAATAGSSATSHSAGASTSTGGTSGNGGASGNGSSAPAAASSSTSGNGGGGGGGGGKAPPPRGRSRRGAIFKKNQPSRTPTVTATTRCVPHVFHRGSYMQIGDIVSLVSHTADVYYAQIRGLLVDSFCEKSAYLTWLLPTRASPPANERFEASTYVIGPDEDFPRRLDCLAFVMHAPSAYYHSRAEPYPAPDGAEGAGGPAAGFIWTSLGEATAQQVTMGHQQATSAAAVVTV